LQEQVLNCALFLDFFSVILWIQNLLLRRFEDLALVKDVFMDVDHRFFHLIAKERFKNSIRRTTLTVFSLFAAQNVDLILLWQVVATNLAI
jgi:hypothetical protein